MSEESIARAPRAAIGLLVLVALLFLLQVGALISGVLADTGGGSASASVEPDLVSDAVAATAAEFRVDESGAATYSVPIYGVPGTAGVAPKLSLNYSSQGGSGPLGKGWTIGGLSSITRCRATREAGDFIVNGAPTDGAPAPVNFSSTDRYCLDGQRLISAQSGSAACPAVNGMIAQNLRTEIESFQRVCAYTPSGGASGPAFFKVERKDGSTSWYGDRNNDAAANQVDAYVNSTTPGKTEFAISWAQTRFQDSTGNYIDYLYYNLQPNADTREHLLKEVQYTGKTVLAGQTGSASAPYAKITFAYSTRASSRWGYGYQSGGRWVQSRRLESVVSTVSGQPARFYQLIYDTTVSGSGVDVLTSVEECRDSTKTVCVAPTTFEWSQAKHELATAAGWNPGYFGSASKFEGYKLGDVDGDGRPDMVWLKDGSSGESCPTEYIMVSFGEFDGNGHQSFSQGVFGGCTPTELMTALGNASWQLFDYTGDGRDDLFVAGEGRWGLFGSVGRTGGQVFGPADLLASLSPAIPMTYTSSESSHPS